MTVDEAQAKRKRRLTKSQQLWMAHVGEFTNGKRTGWGTSMLKTSDVYNGFFVNDKMHGRGSYWFHNVTNSIFYVGELHENNFQGLGKMVFQDGSTYYGSFINNSMSSKRAVMSFANGEKYKGEMEMSKRHGLGEYWSQMSAAQDGAFIHYEGEFRDDLRDGKGVITLRSENGATDPMALRFEGEFRDDKRHGKVEEMTAIRESDQIKVKYKGSLDQKQMMNGMGILEAGNVQYAGEFQIN